MESIRNQEINYLSSLPDICRLDDRVRRIDREKFLQLLRSEKDPAVYNEAMELHSHLCDNENEDFLSRDDSLFSHLLRLRSLEEFQKIFGIPESRQKRSFNSIVRDFEAAVKRFHEAEKRFSEEQSNRMADCVPGVNGSSFSIRRTHRDSDNKDKCIHEYPIFSQFSEEDKEIIHQEKECRYRIISGIREKGFFSHARMIKNILASGISYKCMNDFMQYQFEDGEKEFVKCEKMEDEILQNCGMCRNSFLLTACADKHYQRGSRVFCSECLKKGKRVRRIQGCSSPNCWANNTKAEEMEMADIDELKNAHCCHKRQSSETWIYMMNPIGHITFLENTGLIDRLINYSPTSIHQTLNIIKENGSFSSSLAFNTIFPFKELGESEIALSIWNQYKAIANPKTMRNSLQAVVNKILDENSIERRCYFPKLYDAESEKIERNRVFMENLEIAEQTVAGFRGTETTSRGRKVKKTEKSQQLCDETSSRVQEKARSSTDKALQTEKKKKAKSRKEKTVSPDKKTLLELTLEDLIEVKEKGLYDGIEFHKQLTDQEKIQTVELLINLRQRAKDGNVLLDPIEMLFQDHPVPEFFFNHTDDEFKNRMCWLFPSILEEEGEACDAEAPTFSESDSCTVRFTPPKTGVVVDGFINYILRADGISCTENSITNKTYYVVSLEVANCNDFDKTKTYMTCPGVLFKKGDKDKEGLLFDFDLIEYYIRHVTVLGKTGVYVKSRTGNVWTHWRWFISSVICDTVAQEQLENVPNKKMKRYPCLYNSSCERARFSLDTYGMQRMNVKVPITGKGNVSLMCQPLNFLHPNSFYRCPSFLCWTPNYLQILEEAGLRLSEEQYEEANTLTSLFSLFPKSMLRQYQPTTLSHTDYDLYRKSKLESVLNQNPTTDSNSRDEHESPVDANDVSGHNADDASQPSEENPSIDYYLKSLLVPKEYREGIDSMHGIYNICLLFIKLVNNKYTESVFQQHFNKYVYSVLHGHLSCDMPSKWSLLPDFTPIMLKAKERMKELCKSVHISWLKDNMLEYSNYKVIPDYYDILLLLTYYNFIFVDSMHVPIIFFFKTVFDYLGYFFNANRNINELIRNQLNLSVINGLICNELPLNIPSISFHNSCHLCESIVQSGDLVSTNCFNSEAGYQVIKLNVYACGKPLLNGGRRTIIHCLASGFTEMARPTNVKVFVSCQSQSSQLVIYGDKTMQLDMELLKTIAKYNAYDDAKYFQDSSYPRNTLLDMLLESDIDINHSDIRNVTNEYHNQCQSDINNVLVTEVDEMVYRKLTMKKTYHFDGDLIHEGIINHQRIAYTRRIDGTVVLVVVLGFVRMKINDFNYINALCIPIKTQSGSSFVNTQHYGFIDVNDFKESLNHPRVFAISVYRLNFDKVFTLKYPGKDNCNSLTCYYLNKLTIRQFQSLGQFRDLKKFLASRILRSDNH